ncbi:amidase [Sagittula stellata]|uniref:Amidase n=1 Tax=Sagittula stellata (strain ATCC 700073 / DSM 11524 / E-37) TaxID=388399 RepID=A3K4F9_SAGS3|nr:amidase [Sagittula stellata]EBA07858.1 amidase [Sagittula stellata E-37]
MTLNSMPLGARDTRDAIAAGRLTAVQVTEHRLAQIAEAEPWLRAFVQVDADGARAQARALDAGAGRGLLHGVPLGVKDIFAVDGLAWTAGSPIWKDRIAGFDAPAVALARRAGAVVLGKTVTTEFASYKASRTRNPTATDRSPGGSSSGSAAAVAAGLVPLALGAQTSGSIVRPASFCGEVGFKTSFDTIDSFGVTALARRLDTVGLFACNVPDIGLGIEALSGLALPLATTAQAPCPIGIFRSVAWPEAEPTLLPAWESFEAALASAADTRDALPPGLVAALDAVPALHARLMVWESAEALAHELNTAPDAMSPGLHGQIEEGLTVTPSQRHADRMDLQRLRSRALTELDPAAVWVTPAACGSAPRFEDGTGNPAFNRTWSLLGLPCCAVPLLADEVSAPIGVQVVGAPGNDAGVLAVADWQMHHFAR